MMEHDRERGEAAQAVDEQKSRRAMRTGERGSGLCGGSGIGLRKKPAKYGVRDRFQGIEHRLSRRRSVPQGRQRLRSGPASGDAAVAAGIRLAAFIAPIANVAPASAAPPSWQ
jgi:hypothetical protein